MKSISEAEYQEIRVELKYCERCGGLWLRPEGGNGVYCASCHVYLEARANRKEPQSLRKRGRKPRRERGIDLRSSARIGHLQAVAVIEVRA